METDILKYCKFVTDIYIYLYLYLYIYIERYRLYSESHMNCTLLTLQDKVAYGGLGIHCTYLIESYIPA